MKQKIIIGGDGRYNYHNMCDIVIIAERGRDKTTVVTESQYKRIQRHFCGVKGCECNSGPGVIYEYKDGSKIICTHF